MELKTGDVIHICKSQFTPSSGSSLQYLSYFFLYFSLFLDQNNLVTGFIFTSPQWHDMSKLFADLFQIGTIELFILFKFPLFIVVYAWVIFIRLMWRTIEKLWLFWLFSCLFVVSPVFFAVFFCLYILNTLPSHTCKMLWFVESVRLTGSRNLGIILEGSHGDMLWH